jgi:hypothetical protein
VARSKGRVAYMFEHLRADDATLAARSNLAHQVKAALTYAGLPARSNGAELVRSAAEVEVDVGNDEAGGVWVRWVPSSGLVEAVIDSNRASRTDGPVSESYFTITLAMRNAILQILRHSGFQAYSIDDYAMGPPVIQVLVSNSEAGGDLAQSDATH